MIFHWGRDFVFGFSILHFHVYSSIPAKTCTFLGSHWVRTTMAKEVQAGTASTYVPQDGNKAFLEHVFMARFSQ